ncbi:MAG: hypothetical protein PHW96_04455 [Candidatus Nanoarchaeia archaeon]|nr:hypothetical protein [Candidatus Nanoarchaeia archaeon]
MKILSGEEKEKADYFIKEAVNFALCEDNVPKCKKSLRGVVIVKDDKIIGEGWNKPTLEELTCEPICAREKVHSNADYENCSAIHAEQMAILDVMNKGDLKGAVLYHIKVKDKKPFSSGSPSCTRCSVLIAESGIEYVVLLGALGYQMYTAKEFNELSHIYHTTI